MPDKTPPYGYVDEDKCPRCGSKNHKEGNPYKPDNEDEKVQDTFCEDCGAVLETNPVEESE